MGHIMFRNRATMNANLISRVRAILPIYVLVGVLGLPVTSPLADAAGQAPTSNDPTVLGIQDTRFTLNGQPTFLLGISYYGALGAPEEFIQRDLDDLQTHGFNWLRVWAMWGAFDHDVSAVDAQGGPREPFLDKLQWLVAECDRRGLVVDVTLTRNQPSSQRPSGGGLPDFASHQRAVETLISALKQHRNWYLDLANERDVRDARYVSPTELKTLRELARRLAPSLLVTASLGGHDLTPSDVHDSLVIAGLDFLTPHRPRDAQSPVQTKAQTRACLDLAKAVRIVPVHYQEPFRRGYSPWEPTAADFLTDLRGAVAGGAAGWCFHNGSERRSPDQQPRRSFDLRVKRLFDQLDPEERKVATGVKQASRNSPTTQGAAFKVPRMWEYSAPLIAPERRASNPSRAQKDPSVVFYDGKWHVFMTVKLPGKSALEYCSFGKWEAADTSARTILEVSDSDYYCAPQVFYFRPHKKWYLVYQVGVPGATKMWVAYSTTTDIAAPHTWTRALPILDGGRDDPRKVGGLDYWIICDDQLAYLFLTSLDGKMWRLESRLEDFPRGFGHCELALEAKIFEASHTYKLKGRDKYLTLIEENGRRFYKAYLADRLDGPWVPVADTADRPFAGWKNIRPAAGVEPWTDNISHGELLRDGWDETLTVDPGNLRFIFQGMWDKHKSGREYGQFQWRIGLLTPVSAGTTSE